MTVDNIKPQVDCFVFPDGHCVKVQPVQNGSSQAQKLLLPDHFIVKKFGDDRRCHDEADRTRHHHFCEEKTHVHSAR